MTDVSGTLKCREHIQVVDFYNLKSWPKQKKSIKCVEKNTTAARSFILIVKIQKHNQYTLLMCNF